MIYLLTYIFIAYGTTTIVTEGNIFQPLRDWIGGKSDFVYSIFTCPLCFSTWLGFIMSAMLLITNNPTPSSVFGFPNIVSVFIDGCFTAGTVWFLYKLNNK